MMANVLKADAVSLWYKEEGATGGYTQLTQEIIGMDAVPLAERAKSTVLGKDSQGQFVKLATFNNPPGDNPTTTINFYELWDRIHPLLQFHQKDSKVFIQQMAFQNPNNVDVRSFAKQINHYLVSFSGGERGAAPNITGEGAIKQSNVTPVIEERVEGIRNDLTLSALTSGETVAILSLVGLERQLPDLRENGYRGPDKVLYYGAASGGTQANLLVTVNGGSTISVLGTPFTGSDVDLTALAYQFISETQFRLMIGAEGIVGSDARIAFYDISLGDETTSGTVTATTIADTADASGVDALLWTKYARLYISADSKIYLSTDAGGSDPGAAISSPSQQINALHEDFDGNVWAAGATNTILFEDVNDQGTFVTKTGPSGGGTFTSIARARDGVIYAGNGQSIYRNTNKAANTGGWTQSKDFGAGFTVQEIVCVKGSSEIVCAFVDSASEGQVWKTNDGGATWNKVTVVTNGGYNAAYASQVDPNLFQIVGDASGGAGIIHKLN